MKKQPTQLLLIAALIVLNFFSLPFWGGWGGVAYAQNYLWAKSAGGMANNDRSYSCSTDANGNVVATGYFQSDSITFGGTTLTNMGGGDIFVVQYTPDGTVLWAKSAGGTSGDVGTSIATDASGNVLVTGYFQSDSITFGTTTLTNASGYSIFIVKYAWDGTVLWAKSADGTSWDQAYGISTDASGNVVITGKFSSPSITFDTTTLTNSGAADIFVAKYAPDGTMLWVKREGGTSGDVATCISTDTSGNVMVAGYFDGDSITFGTTTLTNAGSSSTDDIFVVKYAPDGTVLWANSAGGDSDDEITNISTDASGNVVVTGWFYSPFIILGTNTLTNSGAADIFVAKYAPDGTVLWAKSAGGTGQDNAYGISTAPSGNVVVTGTFGNPSITFGTTTLTTVGADDIFVVQYASDGTVLWAKSAGGIDFDWGNGIATDARGNVVVTGWFESPSINFGTTTLTNADNTGNGRDIFVVKLECIVINFSQSPAICDGQSVTVGSNTYTISGTYTDTFMATNGCDSIVTTILTVNPTDTNLQTVTINQGDTLQVGSNFYTTSGTYIDTLKSSNNCDSIVTTNLTVLTGISELQIANCKLQIVPNPFSHQTEISYSLATNSQIKIELYNVLGQKIKTIADEKQGGGEHRYLLDLEKESAEIYFLKMKINDVILMKKIISIQ